MKVLDVGDLTRWSVLHWAAYRNDLPVVRELLWLGVPPDLRANNGITPLHIAALCESSDITTLLYDYGVRVNASTAGDGLTPLHLAACGGNTLNTEKLLYLGAGVKETDSARRTPAHMAALKGCSYGQA